MIIPSKGRRTGWFKHKEISKFGSNTGYMSHDATKAEGNHTISWNTTLGVPGKILVDSCLSSKRENREANVKLYLPIYVFLATSLQRRRSPAACKWRTRSLNVPFELSAE